MANALLRTSLASAMTPPSAFSGLRDLNLGRERVVGWVGCCRESQGQAP